MRQNLNYVDVTPLHIPENNIYSVFGNNYELVAIGVHLNSNESKNSKNIQFFINSMSISSIDLILLKVGTEISSFSVMKYLFKLDGMFPKLTFFLIFVKRGLSNFNNLLSNSILSSFK